MTAFAILLLFFSVVCALLILLCRLDSCRRAPPDFVIGKPGSAYMNRWYVLPRNRFFNIYLHQILRSDDDRALHDHPWINLSILLNGCYREVMPAWLPYEIGSEIVVWRHRGSVVLRRPSAAHRLEVDPGTCVWSLFITGPKVREWGFLCPQGWRHWQDFVDLSETGAIGPGCGEG